MYTYIYFVGIKRRVTKTVLAGDWDVTLQVKFCTYSVIEIEAKILHVETVDKREVDLQSLNMEGKAFRRFMEFLLSHVKCTKIITDASSSIWKDLGLTHLNSNCFFLFIYTETWAPWNTAFLRCVAQNKKATKSTGKGKHN